MLTANNQQIFYINPKHLPQLDREAAKKEIEAKSRAIAEHESKIRDLQSKLQGNQKTIPQLQKERDAV